MRRAGDMVAVLAFFSIAVTLFPLGIGPDPATLAKIAAGVLWIAALLSVMLSLDRLFAADYDDGSLDLLLLAPAPLEVIALAKCLAHWLFAGAPLVIAAPVLGISLNLEFYTAAILVVAMLLGTPILSLVGAIAAALTVSVRRGGALIPLLILPLVVPVLIFGASAIERAAIGVLPGAQLMVLAAMLLAALALAPWAIAAALRLSAE